jgi:DNA-directed RNA polymerase subunit RPC12/RpoP
MGIQQDYDDIMQTSDMICPNCGSLDIVEASFDKDLYLCTECGQIFGAAIEKDDE